MKKKKKRRLPNLDGKKVKLERWRDEKMKWCVKPHNFSPLFPYFSLKTSSLVNKKKEGKRLEFVEKLASLGLEYDVGGVLESRGGASERDIDASWNCEGHFSEEEKRNRRLESFSEKEKLLKKVCFWKSNFASSTFLFRFNSFLQPPFFPFKIVVRKCLRTAEKKGRIVCFVSTTKQDSRHWHLTGGSDVFFCSRSLEKFEVMNNWILVKVEHLSLYPGL